MITIKTTISAPIQKVWNYLNQPEHIINWNFAHESWQCPKAENDFVEGGKFIYRMEAKDGSFGFDLSGFYDKISPHNLLQYHLEDNRKVEVSFEETEENSTIVIQTFEPENQNPLEMQEQGWNAILQNFKKYVEDN